MSNYIILSIILLILLIGMKNKVNCFDSFLLGAKEGIKTSVNMFSNLLVFMVALSFFLSSGIIEYIGQKLNFDYSLIVIQTIVRPMSSSSSLSIMTEIYNTRGIDSLIAIMSTMVHYVSDATLYLVPFYCGVYNIKKYNKILLGGILVNVFSYIIAIIISLFLFNVINK